MTKRNRNHRLQENKDEEVLVDIGKVSREAGTFFEKYQNVIYGSLVGLIVIVGGYFAYKYIYQSPREDQASLALYQAQTQFQKDSFALALSNPGMNGEGFLDIAENYNGTKAGNTALYYAGIAYLQLGQFDEAISYLEDYSPYDDITPIMKYGALADAYSEKQDYAKALSLYEKASSFKNSSLTPYYAYKLALLHKQQGSSDKALEVLRKIKAEYPTSAIIGDVTKQIAMLGK